jgi:hypothetical protein
MNDLDLLALDAETIFVPAQLDRTLPASPRLYMAGCSSGNIVRIRHDVGKHIAEAIERLVAKEPPLCYADSIPVHLDDYVRLLEGEAPVEQTIVELIWTFPERLSYGHRATLVASDTPEGDALLARLEREGMPEALVAAGFVDIGEFWAPWCVAFDGDDIASIAFTVGSGPESAEVGVHTFPAFRGRGFAAAATAGWASLPALRDCSLFYSTSRENVSSQRVTQRLGLRFLGVSLTIR